MAKQRSIKGMAAGLCSALLAAHRASAQMPLPAARPPDGPPLFKQQCATCHTTNLSDPVRQGPSLYRSSGGPLAKRTDFATRTGSPKQTSSGMAPGSMPG